jgi:hypothetical protein
MKDSAESANIPPTEPEEAIAQMNEAQFRFRFRCPESITSDDEREKEVKRFLNWIAAHPRGRGWTLDAVAKFRMSLLKTHQCMETLRNIETNVHSN